MSEELVAALCGEIRADNQIPPYTDDDVIARSVQKCAARLESLKPGVNWDADVLGRAYLKDFVYYDMVHRYEEFLDNYGPDIRSWQLSEVITDAAG